MSSFGAIVYSGMIFTSSGVKARAPYPLFILRATKPHISRRT